MRSAKSTFVSLLTTAALPIVALGMTAAPLAAQQSPQAPAGAPLAVKPNAAKPDPFKLNMLIRGAVIALSQANQTGNYSVLRDIAAPAFREFNNPARLAEIFAPLRARGLDFSPVFFINPVLIKEPEIDRGGVVRVVGYFPSRPQQVVFDMAFQPVNGAWKVISLAVDTRVTPPENGQASAGENARPEQKQASGGKPQAAAQPKPGKTAGGKGQ